MKYLILALTISSSTICIASVIAWAERPPAYNCDPGTPDGEGCKCPAGYKSQPNPNNNIPRCVKSEPPPPKRPPHPITDIDLAKLRSGINLGWQLGRLEILQGADLPEAQTQAKVIVNYLRDYLKQEGMEYKDVSFHELTAYIMSYYERTDPSKLAATMVGICAIRLSLSRTKDSDSQISREFQEIAFSALQEIDDDFLPGIDRRRFFDEMKKASLQNVVETARFVRNFKLSSKR